MPDHQKPRPSVYRSTAKSVTAQKPNSTLLVTSRLDTLDTSNVLSCVETCRDKPSGIWAQRCVCVSALSTRATCTRVAVSSLRPVSFSLPATLPPPIHNTGHAGSSTHTGRVTVDQGNRVPTGVLSPAGTLEVVLRHGSLYGQNASPWSLSGRQHVW